MEYLYGMKYRPFGIGCQPKDSIVDVRESDDYYDIVVYDRQLTEDEIKQFELVAIV